MLTDSAGVLSFRLIVFDNKLGITRSLQALVTNGEFGRLGPPAIRESTYCPQQDRVQEAID